MKNIIIIVLALVVAGGGFYFLNQNKSREEIMLRLAVLEGRLEAISINPLAGVWQSTEDANFVRNIYENGGYSDLYEGEETSNGPWVTFMSENAPEEFPYTLEEGAEYLELQDTEGSLYFKIAEVTEEKLVLIYLDRGGVLEFVRI